MNHDIFGTSPTIGTLPHAQSDCTGRFADHMLQATKVTVANPENVGLLDKEPIIGDSEPRAS